MRFVVGDRAWVCFARLVMKSEDNAPVRYLGIGTYEDNLIEWNYLLEITDPR